MQLHHLNGFIAQVMGVYIGGFFGSITNLTMITELSTSFVSIRVVLAIHHLQDTVFYFWNGLALTFSFLFFRVFFYYYIIFWKVVDFCCYRQSSFWATYPPEMHKFCYLGIFLYILMYLLQLFWFSKIIEGCLKQLGVTDAIEETEQQRLYRDN